MTKDDFWRSKTILEVEKWKRGAEDFGGGKMKESGGF
jgi:hypothetical protein